MANEVVISASLGSDEYLETRTVKRKAQPNFYKVGNGTMNKHKIQSIDLLGAVMDMTKAEQLVISTIKELITWDGQTGEVHIPMKGTFTSSEAKVFNKGFKKLKEKDLVRRTKQSHYMINPRALIPFDFSKATELWDSV